MKTSLSNSDRQGVSTRPASTLAPQLLVDEETNQLLACGLRPPNASKSTSFSLSDSEPSYREISLGVESLTSCSFLRAFTQLKRLQLNVNKLRTLNGLEHMTELEELSIKDNALCSLTTISTLFALRSLRRQNHQI